MRCPTRSRREHVSTLEPDPKLDNPEGDPEPLEFGPSLIPVPPTPREQLEPSLLETVVRVIAIKEQTVKDRQRQLEDAGFTNHKNPAEWLETAEACKLLS